MRAVNNRSILKNNEKGATIILFAIFLGMFIGFAALAIDVGHLYLVKNELQNAADAGALAGALSLYMDDGQSVNPGANQHAYDAAVAHISENTPVEVNWTAGTNSGDVQRGHWSFTTQTFTPDGSLSPVDLWDISGSQLDTYNPIAPFINAVRVRARRSTTPVASFFARIFGHESFLMAAEAVAYIGFAGSLQPHDVDQPIAICKQSITDIYGNFTCNMGRMINSGSNPETNNTAGWINYTQPCITTSTPTVRPLICSGGNPDPINYGDGIGGTGGNLSNIMRDLKECWLDPNTHNWGVDEDGDPLDLGPLDTDDDGIPDVLWQVTLPVVDCPGNNVSNCPTASGAVHIKIIWILDNWDPNKLQWIYDQWYEGNLSQEELSELIPDRMEGWNSGMEPENWSVSGYSGPYNGENPIHRWYSFVKFFNLQNLDGTPAPYQNMAIYFTPACDYFEPIGTSQGENYGILAKIPVLVK
ncbi:MAG: hypothetical protein JSV50_05475 [Desulfobacteraceae bacterium]|nr:MAG: hypothetical protein JSV50_05475 [Desulfobacteraceae bacterium]